MVDGRVTDLRSLYDVWRPRAASGLEVDELELMELANKVPPGFEATARDADCQRTDLLIES